MISVELCSGKAEIPRPLTCVEICAGAGGQALGLAMAGFVHVALVEYEEDYFIAIGRERNRLVHQNYIEAQINDTFEEIWDKYTRACDFVELITYLLSP